MFLTYYVFIHKYHSLRRSEDDEEDDQLFLDARATAPTTAHLTLTPRPTTAVVYLDPQALRDRGQGRLVLLVPLDKRVRVEGEALVLCLSGRRQLLDFDDFDLVEGREKVQVGVLLVQKMYEVVCHEVSRVELQAVVPVRVVRVVREQGPE